MTLAIIAAVTLSTLSDMPWIGDGEAERKGADWYKDDPAPVFSAEFVLPRGGISRTAKMHVASPCCYFLTVNGASVSGLPIATFPLWSPYDKTIYAETFPVSHLLSPYPATNRVQLVLGNGWYNMPPLKFWGSICFRDHLASGRPCFKLAIDDVHGLNWTRRTCNLVQNSFHLGETFDLTRPPDREEKAAYEVRGPQGKIVLRTAPAIGPQERNGEKGTARWLKEGEVQVVDFGSNRTAVYLFDIRTEGLKKGDRLEFVYGERLNADGSVNPLTQTAGQIKRRGRGGPGAPDVAMQKDVVIADGRGKMLFFNNAVTWHVARYVEIRGCRKLLTPDEIARMPIGSRVVPVEPGASIKSASAELNRIHEMCVRTFLANLMGVQSDCPGRERLGYGGDIVATCEAMMLNFDMKEFYLKTLQDFADEAEDDGWITETAPYVGIGNKGFGGSKRSGPISWTVVVPVLMDGIIRRYPDAKERALRFYPVCTRYIALVDAANPSGIIPKCIGDHEALERAADEVTATAHWHEFVRLTAKFAALLGKTDERGKYEALANRIAKAFQAKYVKNGVVDNGSQSAQSIALYLGLVPADQIAAAETRLLKAIEEKDFAPSTGIFSTRYMLMYLSEHGCRDVAEKIVLHKGFPGWLHMLERGATTLWETWKESDDSYSNCHPMFGSVDEWILKYGKK